MSFSIIKWKQFLKESTVDNFDHNIQQVMSTLSIYDRTIGDILSIDHNVQQLRQFSPLINEKIIRMIGRGMFGGAFLLENGNILKLGMKSFGDNKTGADEFISNKFSGNARKTDPNIYYYKSITLHDITGQSHTFECKETSAYIPLEQHIERLGVPKAYSHVVTSTMGFSTQVIDNYLDGIQQSLGPSATNKQLKEALYDVITQEVEGLYPQGIKTIERFHLTKEFRKLFDTAVDFILRNPEDCDLHEGNIGVDQSGNYVFFDY